MDGLPLLCIKTIAEQLILLNAEKAHHDFDVLLLNANCAARLALAGGTCTEIAMDLYNTAVDPGCLDEANTICKQDAYERDAATLVLETTTIVATTGDSSKLADLKVACVAASLPVSVTKAKLIERLDHARCVAVARLAQPCAIMPRCPVRRRVAALVFASRSSEHRNIVATTALKEPFKIPRADLEKMPCELARNPHYRSASPMRLYNLMDLAWASLQINGPGTVPMRCVDEAAARDMAAKATAKANKLAAICAKRRENLLRAMQILECPFDIDVVTSKSQILTDYMNGSQTHKELNVEALNTAIDTTQRSKDLKEALNVAGCELRRDSNLCNVYIHHGIGSIAEIVIIMTEMQFYFAHTNYRQILNDLYKQNRLVQNSSALSERAKAKALAAYIRKMRQPLSWEIIQEDQNLPASLKQKIQK